MMDGLAMLPGRDPRAEVVFAGHDTSSGRTADAERVRTSVGVDGARQSARLLSLSIRPLSRRLSCWSRRLRVGPADVYGEATWLCALEEAKGCDRLDWRVSKSSCAAGLCSPPSSAQLIVVESSRPRPSPTPSLLPLFAHAQLFRPEAAWKQTLYQVLQCGERDKGLGRNV